MGETKIEWTDATWNPVRGCTKISPGCKHCYAETFAERFRGVKGHPYEQGFDLRLVPEKLTEPLRWKKPRRIFVNSMSDLFQDGVPDEFIDQVWATMLLAPHHTFQILTKRPERMHRYLTAAGLYERVLRAANCIRESRPDLRLVGISNPTAFPRKWIWLGTSVENQEAADSRIPELLQTPAAVRFLSIEPLLGPVTLPACWNSAEIETGQTSSTWRHGIDWVIVGGESGPDARPMNPGWARSIRDQCQAAGVPFFFKQWGALVPLDGVHGTAWLDGKCGVNGQWHPGQLVVDQEQHYVRVGKKVAGRLLDGREWSEYPRPWVAPEERG